MWFTSEKEREEELAVEQRWQSRLQIFDIIKKKFPIGSTLKILGVEHVIISYQSPTRACGFMPMYEAALCYIYVINGEVKSSRFFEGSFGYLLSL